MPIASFERIFEKSPNAYMLLDREYRFVAANQAYLELTASKRENIIGRGMFEVFPDDPANSHRDSQNLLRASFDRVFKKGEADILAWISYSVPMKTPTGTVLAERFWSAIHTPILDEHGQTEFLLQHTVDISDMDRTSPSQPPYPSTQEASVIRRVQAVQEVNTSLQSERRRLLTLFEQAPGFLAILTGPDYVFELANQSYYALVGYRELLGRSVEQALPEVASQGFMDLLNQAYQSGEPFVGRRMEVSFQATSQAPARTAFVDFVLQPVQERDGSISAIFVQGNEVTERVAAEQELRRYQEHLEELVQERTQALTASQAALQQAQKMEAVGRLTGGIAHDFNNLLQIIAGNLQLAQRDLGADALNERRLQNAINAVDRGARLATQLLAFARQQPLEPRVINPGKLLLGMNDLLRHALGVGVETETVLAEDLWNTFCDATQLENVILNLIINARDAMGGNGKLTIELNNAQLDQTYASQHEEVSAGDYVALVVTDTGCGMPADIVRQVFEPFFSTKSPDQGTGLGLSMVYGFVKQTGGHISIYSEEGQGTSVKVYLPRSTNLEYQEAPELNTLVRGGNETILVVEDDEEVRDTVTTLLTDLGYRVLRAADGQSALAILQSGIPINLLFTDVVMPGPVSAVELVQHTEKLWPNAAVLFTSGYTGNAIVHNGTMAHGGQVDPDMQLISKPYRQQDLARKIRHVLDTNQRRPQTRSATPALSFLIVEDAVDVRHTLAVFLRNIGHKVMELGTAEAALESLEQTAFDVLITDISLPGLSGLELASRIEKTHPHIAIIIASGYGKPSSDDKLDQYRWLQKPYSFAHLEALLEDLVKPDVGS